MFTYEIIDSKTGKTVEQADFTSGGNAKKYAESMGKRYYAKRVLSSAPAVTGDTVSAPIVVEAAAETDAVEAEINTLFTFTSVNDDIKEINKAKCDRVALELIREYLNNKNLTLNDLAQVRLEETGQTLGQVLIGEDEVIEHLRTLTIDKGNEWSGVDTGDLYSDDAGSVLGVTYLGDDTWYQGY